jgi:glucokinase
VKVQYLGLVGDVGGTNARLALVDAEGRVRNLHVYSARDYHSLTDIIADYLKRTVGEKKRPPRAVIAAAGPVLDGEIEFTNLDWRVSEGDLLAHFEFEAVKLINDFTAQALACPRLETADLRPIGPAMRGAAEAPLVVMGAGTGFGVAGLARSDRGDVALSTEGGHAGFSPTDEVEVQVWTRLAARFGRVSIERLMSGRGMFDLYQALAQINGVSAELADEKAVNEAAMAGDALAGQTLDRFCAIMGSVAGDIALTFGARGGVYISGGIAPRMSDRLASGGFRARFEDKGRMRSYMEQIPTSLVLHPYAALLGAARELETMERL